MTIAARGELRGTLIAAALTLLESGTGDLSLRAVARAAGVSAMAPYRHFDDKAALLAAVAEEGFAGLRERMIAADGAPEPRAAVLAQGLAYIAFARARPALFRLMFGDQLRPVKSDGKDSGGFDILTRRVAQLVPDDTQSAALASWSIVHGLATLALDGRLEGIEPDHERRALSLFVAALGKA